MKALLTENECPLVSENAHTVSVKLGEVHNPNVNLYICLIGTKGETPKVSLRPESLTLERNKTYKFTLAPTMDLGRVRHRLSSSYLLVTIQYNTIQCKTIPYNAKQYIQNNKLYLTGDTLVAIIQLYNSIFPRWPSKNRMNSQTEMEKTEKNRKIANIFNVYLHERLGKWNKWKIDIHLTNNLDYLN